MPIWKPQIVHPCTTSLALAPRWIGKTNFSKTARARLDVASPGVLKQSELQGSQGLFKLKRGNPFREDGRLNERQQFGRYYHTEAYYNVGVKTRLDGRRLQENIVLLIF